MIDKRYFGRLTISRWEFLNKAVRFNQAVFANRKGLWGDSWEQNKFAKSMSNLYAFVAGSSPHDSSLYQGFVRDSNGDQSTSDYDAKYKMFYLVKKNIVYNRIMAPKSLAIYNDSIIFVDGKGIDEVSTQKIGALIGEYIGESNNDNRTMIKPPFYKSGRYLDWFQKRMTPLNKISIVQGDSWPGWKAVPSHHSWFSGEAFYVNQNREPYFLPIDLLIHRVLGDGGLGSNGIGGITMYYVRHEVRFLDYYMEVKVFSEGNLRDKYGEMIQLAIVSYTAFQIVDIQVIFKKVL